MSDQSAQARYIYLLPGGFETTVTDSQVVEPLRQLAERGLVFDVIAWTGLKPALRQWAALAALMKQAQAQIAPCRTWLYPIPFPNRLTGRLILAALIAERVAVDIAGGRSMVCHCRGHSAASVAMILARRLPRFRYVFDMRGDVAAETQTYLGWQGSPEDWKKTGIYREIKRQEAQAIEQASQIICVSERFRSQVAQEYPAAVNKLHVIPCVASEKLFCFDPVVRAKIRAKLNLADRIVIVYAGALMANWHIPDVMAHLFGEWHRRDARLHWLLVTRDPEIAQRLLEQKHLSPADATVVSATHKDVAAYLMAGDVGLLLRQSHPLNQVASPTKFAEYAMTGLPVLASAGIGDLDEDIPAHGLGVLVQRLDDLEHTGQQLSSVLALPSSDADRAQRAARARDVYSAEKILEQRVSLYGKM